MAFPRWRLNFPGGLPPLFSYFPSSFHASFVRHPNLVRLLSFSEQDGVPSLVMERVDMNLTEFLGTNPDLSSRLEVLADVCEALKHLLDSCIAISIQITWASIGTKLRVEQFKRSCSTWASSKATPPLC